MKVVISLGGSIVNPGKINIEFLKEFKKVIKKFKRDKIVIVVGGGKIARDYIEALSFKDKKVRAFLGIEATKINAMLVSNFLDNEVLVPTSLSKVKEKINKKNLVVCGGLGYRPYMTSDGIAAEIAEAIKADYFVNMTDVKGLYDKDPKKNKNAKFISRISFKDMEKISNKRKFIPGQHFVLDQYASKLILKNKIKTIILKGAKNLEDFLKKDKFTGTIVS